MRQLIFVGYKYYNNDTILEFIKEIFSMIDYDYEECIVYEERSYLPQEFLDHSNQLHNPIRSQSLEIMILTINTVLMPESFINFIKDLPNLRKELKKGFVTEDYYSIRGVKPTDKKPYKQIDQIVEEGIIPEYLLKEMRKKDAKDKESEDKDIQ